ncbi:MAG: protein translocase subunit SecF [Gemmatimonadetes bacterium]|nr:protein translocase subunit SecF [Gemmatimonadota bacterium]
MFRVFENADYAFIANRKKAYVVSAVATIVTVLAMAFNVATLGSWLNYGVDFTGGSLVQVRFEGPVEDSELRTALGGADAPPITRFGEAAQHEFVIRAPLAEGASITAVAEGIQAQIRDGLPGRNFDVVRTELVGAKIGGEMQGRAGMAILISFVLTLIYLAVRFEFRFGVAAVIATAHDVMLTLGVLALLRMEVSLATVAAILTILGYSLNDTIVVFDRIRENLHMKGARKRDPLELVNRSVNETLPRTVLTGGATLAVLLALTLLGGPVIREFAVVMIFGIVVGTYSSIFIGSAALIEIQKRWGIGEIREKPPRPEPATA